MSDTSAAGPDTQKPPGAITREATICNKKGLHARASAKFVQTVERFEAEIRVTRGHDSAGGTSIMGLMTLAAGPGTVLTIDAWGPQAVEAMDAVTALIAARFHEEE